MKVFWAILILLMLAGAGYLAFGRGQSSPREGSVSMESARSLPAPSPTPPAPARSFGEPALTTPRKDNTESAFFPDAAPASGAGVTPSPAPTSTPAPVAAPTPEPVPAPAPAPGVDDPEVVRDTPGDVPESVPAPAVKPADSTPATSTPGAPPAPPPSPPPAAASAGDTTGGVTFGEDAKVATMDDGSLMVDEKYPLKGEGTPEKPYEITWEYLVSAQEDYQPRLGKKKLPGRMKLITGKHVRITGFVAFPIMATEPTEMLAMLNQWDGCCIGIPPTPYDAIEVKLSDPATNEERLMTYGTVEGKLHVEPYLVRDWLVSLYSLEEATMERAQ